MKLINIKPKQALNKAFLKVKPVRKEIETFKTNLTELLDRTNDTESEEFHKNLVSDFLKKTYYEPNFYINTKGRQDLVIHNGNKAKDPVGVILETKKPTNKNEMVSENRLNVKAFQELVLYYLRERITEKNLEVKYLIITNIHEWYIFNAADFEKHFAQNKAFVKQFQDFENGSLSGTKTDFFYKEIAFPAIENITEDIECTHFDIRDYEKALRNDDLKDDVKLIALFKLLSPQHVLKRPFTNDSNSLDKRFYAELLHIIGLTEEKDGGKKIIQRQKTGQRNHGALLEDAIVQLDSLDKISRLEKPSQFGANNEERLFNVGLELSITWMNRILFLKLLEAQLQTYHNGDKKYAFLNSDRIRNYDDLNTLFFQVLARKYDERNEFVQKEFADVPYLNSSLFEPTDLEHYCFSIVQLNNSAEMPLYSSTVLKDSQGKRRSGKMNTLDYLFAFLNAYDFSGEGSEDIQEDNKTLINASVLGLIFEKINGYKDGSFFTPGFITMYMCRETIRKAVVQKFNEALVSQKNATDSASPNELEQTYETITDVYNAIGSRGQFTHQEANGLINDVKICDPAVGSGHFLVSALNEMIAVKHELGVLHDRQGKLLRDYDIHVENDELIVTDYNGELFEYQLSNRESQRVQETLFHEKQTIIENCLFGVDINPNSVKICRLRLWIELLKNAYYKNETELETLPNIDINIKCGNSLISRFGLDADLKKALKQSKWNIDSYRIAVQTYRNAQSKDEKREMERLIADIKSNFRSEIGLSDPKLVRLYKLKGELMAQTTQTGLFERSRKEIIAFNKATKKLSDEINKLETEVEEIKSNKIYENAFEWRFEFPEVLDDEGNFVGFDVVIGNPPYVRQEEFKEIKPYLQNRYTCFSATADLYVYFVNLGFNLLKEYGKFTFIIPNKWIRAGYGEKLREYLLTKNIELIVDFGDLPVFEEATTYPCILEISNTSNYSNFYFTSIDSLQFVNGLNDGIKLNQIEIGVSSLSEKGWNLSNQSSLQFIEKIKNKSILLKDYVNDTIFRGIVTGCNEAFIIDEKTKNELIEKDIKSKQIIKPFLAGRDIKRYENPVVTKYIILAERGIEIEKYSAILEHLSKFKSKLEKKAGSAQWYELQASPGDSMKFEKTKIMYPDISKNLNFIIDCQGNYSVNTVYNIGSDSRGLLGYLNSKLFLFYFKTVSNSIRGGYLRFFTEYMKGCPIPNGVDSLESIVNQILSIKKSDPISDTTALEREIDKLVYELYELTDEEIQIVENN
jgi:adenine-specific DNA-methyltransferase